MIRFETKFNSNTASNANKKVFKKNWPLFLIMSIFLVFCGIMCIVDAESRGDVAYGIFCICFGLYFFPLIIFLTKIIQKSFNKSMYILSDETT